MNLGEFRKRTANLPDDTEIVQEYEALEYHQAEIRWILFPVLDNPYTILLEGGQPINLDLDLDNRIDAALIYGDVEDQEEEKSRKPYNEDDCPLYNADPDCDHEIVIQRSGYRCAKCPGWFCL